MRNNLRAESSGKLATARQGESDRRTAAPIRSPSGEQVLASLREPHKGSEFVSDQLIILDRAFDACPILIDATAAAQERGIATLVARRGAAALLLLSKEGDRADARSGSARRNDDRRSFARLVDGSGYVGPDPPTAPLVETSEESHLARPISRNRIDRRNGVIWVTFADEAMRRVTVGSRLGGQIVSRSTVFDAVGGDISPMAFRTLGWRGQHLVVGFAAGKIPALALNIALLKGASLVGVDSA